MIVVNGQYPGPTIEANRGDDVKIKVCNKLSINGTGMHGPSTANWDVDPGPLLLTGSRHPDHHPV